VDDTHLLISDLDGTLLGDDAALQRFVAWHRGQRHRLRLVYNSGRLFDSIQRSVQEFGLPEPDAVIGGVGTEVREFPSGRVINAWPECARNGWQPDPILGLITAMPGIELQPADNLTHYKLSFFYRDASSQQLDDLLATLHQAGHAVEIIYSSRRDLDILPRGVNKGTAAAFLAQCWQIPSQRVMVSGDTGNDLAMFGLGFRGIVVGNAHDELRQLSSPDVYQARQSYAAGVLEGLEYWLSQ
jgi:mannosylfructose-6-phosphate phosphatase